MTQRTTGTYETSTAGGEAVAAFVPHALPPADPPLALDAAATDRLRDAEQALVRLELAGEMVPSLDWFVYAFVRKEAVLSSQIEGTQATLVDLLSFEAREGVAAATANPDVAEVCNFLDALAFARGQLADPAGLPLSMRLLNETHKRLMRGVRGAEKQPGILSAFESYIHAEDDLPPLVRAGLLHVQFETIHPYLDGNGRIGRLLLTLLLEHWKLLPKPLLYLSLFFKRHREEYYRRLDAVRVEGDWEGWLGFFLDGVALIADEAASSARELFGLVAEDRERVLGNARASVAALRLFELLPRHPIVSVALVMKRLATSKPTAGRAVGVLTDAGVLVETTGKKRDRSWAYKSYLDLLRVGTEIERLSVST